MTLYYSIIFGLLMTEMALFLAILPPLPSKFQWAVLQAMSGSPIIAKLQYSAKIMFLFILVLFLDSVNRVFKADTEAYNVSEGMSRETLRYDLQARKFYAQRNLYLCGFTLFLAMVLSRTFRLMRDLLRLEKRVAEAEASNSTKAKDTEEANINKKELKAKQEELDSLKKAHAELQDEYASFRAKANESKKVK